MRWRAGHVPCRWWLAPLVVNPLGLEDSTQRKPGLHAMGVATKASACAGYVRLCDERVLSDWLGLFFPCFCKDVRQPQAFRPSCGWQSAVAMRARCARETWLFGGALNICALHLLGRLEQRGYIATCKYPLFFCDSNIVGPPSWRT